MTDSRLIDSSVLLHYLINGQYKEYIEQNEFVYISILSLFEIKRKLLKDQFEEERITKAINFIEKKTLIIVPTREIVLQAAQFSIKYKIAAMDALIYASAQSNSSTLITCDNDFRNLPDTIILP
ncbi:PIN domain-containing protein [Candidatus Woesearchaeota archaeon]|nr:PIN domain-containing protein [Candidatus Woesearchaeota archaeon]